MVKSRQEMMVAWIRVVTVKMVTAEAARGGGTLDRKHPRSKASGFAVWT